MTEPMVISGVVKWCWSRLQGGVVGWDAYELFKVGEFGKYHVPITDMSMYLLVAYAHMLRHQTPIWPGILSRPSFQSVWRMELARG